MSRPRLTLIVNNDVPCAGDTAGAAQTSWSNRFEPHALRVNAADLWSAYFRARFASPREVALIAGASDRLLVLKVRPTFGRTVIASVEVEVSWVAYRRLVQEGAGMLRRGRRFGGA